MAKAEPVDWLSVESEYRANRHSIRQIARDHGTSEGTIRRRAKKFGWLRDGTKIKREMVKAHYAGVPLTEDKEESVTISEAIEIAALDDIQDMDIGLRNARLALEIVNQTLQRIQQTPATMEMLAFDAKNLKVLTESNKYNVEVIRRIRGLDDPEQANTKDMSESEIDARIEEIARKLA
ncbi:hypothetical protein [Algicola sagamiensis]|uniref:hypothetical protein n=1 Tax=Algicola sagamiensis TaxID=163869 RepID=UPI000379CA58|nr:hypothetical protein [Algicola sagamiensis]